MLKDISIICCLQRMIPRILQNGSSRPSSVWNTTNLTMLSCSWTNMLIYVVWTRGWTSSWELCISKLNSMLEPRTIFIPCSSRIGSTFKLMSLWHSSTRPLIDPVCLESILPSPKSRGCANSVANWLPKTTILRISGNRLFNTKLRSSTTKQLSQKINPSNLMTQIKYSLS